MARYWIRVYRRLRNDPAALEEVLRAYPLPSGRRACKGPCGVELFEDADRYLDDLLHLLEPHEAARLRPLKESRSAGDLHALLGLTFEGETPRARYEARRKLCLANLLFTVDHCRSVRDGPRHRQWFESLLEEHLWRDLKVGAETELCCLVRPQEDGRVEFHIGVEPSGEARCFKMLRRQLPALGPHEPIEILSSRVRFKREATARVEGPADDGTVRVVDQALWPQLGRRSGSILSKMIRRGIGDPSRVEDILGALFVVAERHQVYALERRLLDIFGGPMRFRDRVDTLSGGGAAADLNRHSSASYQVLKVMVDVLCEDDPSAAPYLFPVELQIYDLESYLQTLHDAHYASHTSYKRRQFLDELLPALFPAEVFAETGSAPVDSDPGRGVGQD